MIKHSKSLFLSLLIHSILFATLFTTYEVIAQKKEMPDEKRVCINLKTIHTQMQTQHQTKTKSVKKDVPKVKKKVIHEKVRKPIPKKHKSVPTSKPKPKPLPAVVPEQKKQKKEDKEMLPHNESHEVHEKHEMVKKATPQKECEKPRDKDNYVDNNIAKIAQLIQENLYYPRRARRRGIEGTVKVKFFLHKDATVSQASVIASNSAILSRSAIKTITDLSGSFPKPSNELTLTVPISYSLH